ncbi:MAG TPA: DUF47 family protein [Candidatus Limnocylindria bacterium]|jgi:uncharacterized protein Yka (UPF0111/DUF47 family)|nr:DUF47 family protein [Candidatus Limnocylindria bacterium]
MFSLQKLLGRDDVFFDLLDKSAEEARESVRLLVQLLGAPEKGVISLDEFALLRKKDKRITEELNTRLTQTFATPIEREDIEALSTALYKIPKTLEKFGERLLLSRSRVGTADFSRQVQLLESAIGTVQQLVKDLRASKLDVVKERNDKLQYLEGEADKLMMELLRGLYNGEDDPIRVIALKDLYELLEKVIDRCRDAGNIVFHIVLKNS